MLLRKYFDVINSDFLYYSVLTDFLYYKLLKNGIKGYHIKCENGITCHPNYINLIGNDT